ncbi:hypothetical protein CHARACLAT_016416, partial [Characodon lateralis]|nr:hypothetical protein [Characodon lateralis]
MDQYEDREEGVPPSKTTLCGEHEDQSTGQRIHQRVKPEGESEPSCVSFSSDKSMFQNIEFASHRPPASKRDDWQSLDVSIDQSGREDPTQLDSIFMLLEDNIVTFVRKELKIIQTFLSTNSPELFENQKEDEEVLEGDDEEQRRSSRKALVKIALNFLKRMNHEELAVSLQR